MSIIYNFEGSGVQSWVNANHAHLIALSFSQFLLEFKKKFLPHNWQDDLITTQIRMQGLNPFLSWTKSICKANTKLGIAKSTYHIKEDRLCAHFVLRLSPELKLSYDAQNTHLNLDKIMDLDTWIEHVHLLDLELINKRAEWLNITIESGQTLAAPKPCTVLCNSSVINTANSSNSPATTSTAKPGTGTPKLTNAKHKLLKAHHGCYWCQIFYVGHVSPNCTLGPNNQPTPKACKNVTLANALKAKAIFKKKQGVTMVAAVFGGDSNDSDVILDNKDINEYVPSDLSLPKHLWWTCCIDAPATCVPTPI